MAQEEVSKIVLPMHGNLSPTSCWMPKKKIRCFTEPCRYNHGSMQLG